MSRKHYQAIAAVLADTDGKHDYRCKAAVAAALADYFAADNPRFDRDRFMAACGVEV